MSKELNEYNVVSIYKHQALKMMNFYKSEDVENFYEWLNRFEYVANVINVPDIKMVEFFKKMVDKAVRKKIEKTLFSINFSLLSYDQMINNYLYYFYLSYQTGHQNRFNIRNQYENEPIRHYACRLVKIYNKCGYNNIIHNKLYERFLHGLRENLIRNHLSESIFLSLDDMVEKAIEFEKVNLITYYLDRVLLMINSYNQKKGLFYVWLNKFEYVADRLEVPDDKMLDLFNKMVDYDVHLFIQLDSISVNFSKLSYDETTKLYCNYFFSSTKIDLNEKRLLCRDQYERETIEKYADSLKKIYNKWNNTNFPEERLSEQFINGLDDNNIKDFLKTRPGLSFDQTVAWAIKLKRDNQINSYLYQILSRINIFHPTIESSFYDWLNRFEYVTSMLAIPDDLIIELFNRMVHNDVHANVQMSYSHIDISKLSYDKLINNYLSIFISSDELYLHRNRFIFRNQYEHETIENYFYNLKQIIKKCHYKQNERELLFQQFINGLRENGIRIHLKENPNLNYEELVEEAIKYEKAHLISYYLNRMLLFIAIYNPEKERLFYNWLNRFEYLADMIKVPNDKMIELFNKMVDNNIHTSVQKTYLSVDFSKLSYKTIMDYYLLYFPTSHDIDVHKQRFLSRYQYKGESIEQYAVNLQKLRQEYFYKSGLKESLRKQFIRGIRDNNLKNYLKEISNLLFEEMVVSAIEFTIKENNLKCCNQT